MRTFVQTLHRHAVSVDCRTSMLLWVVSLTWRTFTKDVTTCDPRCSSVFLLVTLVKICGFYVVEFFEVHTRQGTVGATFLCRIHTKIETITVPTCLSPARAVQHGVRRWCHQQVRSGSCRSTDDRQTDDCLCV